MDVKDKVVVITGGAGGIGRAMAERFAASGARHIAVADRDAASALTVADAVGGSAHDVDVANEADIVRLVADVTRHVGPIDLFCSNAGVLPPDMDLSLAVSADDRAWALAWSVNVMAHVYAARAVLPAMIARGEGYLLNTVSAAGLLTMIGSAAYATTKHAAIGLAESLAIAHADDGIRVSVLCPQAVATPMAAGDVHFGADIDGILTPEAVADCVVEGLTAERFLILPHPKALDYLQRKTADYDGWLAGLSRFRRQFITQAAPSRFSRRRSVV
ncbi:SDR family oxidoreductase [Brevundimonas aurifodinae]|uniref:SDR family oxidoreductase n=1 Tax=Brevundimonas aurifodinae TaxID=1508312 RepID=A0ABV1NMC8_9CAUL